MAREGDRAKPSIPAIPKSAIGTDRQAFDHAVKANLDQLLGRVGEQVATLPSTASLEEAIAKINEIIQRLR